MRTITTVPSGDGPSTTLIGTSRTGRRGTSTGPGGRGCRPPYQYTRLRAVRVGTYRSITPGS